MRNLLERAGKATGRLMTERSISQKTLSRICIGAFIAMVLPLVIIALYNYPADDDFAFMLPVATAWVETGSLLEVGRAIWQKTYETYMTWQGDFVSTAFFSFSPMVFNLDYYFISNWILLALLCLSAAYLVKSAMQYLRAFSWQLFWIVYTAIMVLVLQFMPNIGEGVFWHNGGMYTVVTCTLWITLGLLLRASMPQSRGKAIWRNILLALCGFMLGGSFYGPSLGAFIIVLLLTISTLVRRSPSRWQYVITLGFFAVAFVISFIAPGNTLRQERLGDAMNPLAAIFTAVLDSFDLIGGWLTPQLLAVLMLLIPALWKPLRDSTFSFKHPFAFMVLLFGLFSATLVPGIYTGSSYGMGRYMNVIYFYFLTLALGSAIYWEGWLIHFLERMQEGSKGRQWLALSGDLGKRFAAGYLALCIALLGLGGFAFTIMNTASISAAKSLVTGEAAEFRQNMEKRQEYIRITDSDVVQVESLPRQPYVFKADKLPFQGIYGRVRYMKWYFELFYNAGRAKED